LVADKRHDSGVPEHETLDAETAAVLVKVPIRPKTKPAMEVAATRVIAMSITVARTGEIPFLLLPVCIGHLRSAFG